MTTYFIVSKNDEAPPLKLLLPSNSNSSGGGGNNPEQNGGGNANGGNPNGSKGNAHSSNNNNNGSMTSNSSQFSANQEGGQQRLSHNLGPPIRGSSAGLWAAREHRDSSMLPVIREDVLSPVNDDFSFSDTSQRLPSYNEPKPIIFEKTQEKILIDVEIVPWSQPSTIKEPLSQMLVQATSKNYKGSRSTKVLSSGMQESLLETNLDSLSQNAYGAINSKLAIASSKRDFFFDKNSSIQIKSHLSDLKPFTSPSISHRTTHSLADTTKATIQSEESIDKILDDTQYGGPEQDSSIYNISSNESAHLSDSAYGHIIKRSSNYARECIENDFYKSRHKKMKRSSAPKYSVDDSKDDYCVFIKRDQSEGPGMSPRQALHQQQQYYISKPGPHRACQSSHFQAHNSPMIVHRFYHIGTNEPTSEVASSSSPFNGRKGAPHFVPPSHGKRLLNKARTDDISRPLLPQLPFRGKGRYGESRVQVSPFQWHSTILSDFFSRSKNLHLFRIALLS